METVHDSKDEAEDLAQPGGLSVAKVYRGTQTPSRQSYVPLGFFMVEVAIALLGFLVLGFYVVVLLPLHLIPVSLTNSNPYWFRELSADIWNRWMAANKNSYGNAVTFTPLPPTE